MNGAGAAVGAILTALIGVAIIAVLVGTTSKTADVLTAAGNAFSGILRVAVSPVTAGQGGASGSGTTF